MYRNNRASQILPSLNPQHLLVLGDYYRIIMPFIFLHQQLMGNFLRYKPVFSFTQASATAIMTTIKGMFGS
jgi:hypothetical protein